MKAYKCMFSFFSPPEWLIESSGLYKNFKTVRVDTMLKFSEDNNHRA